ncbi:hypothetical protein IQ241_18305 [Romeria aff. gracilis LEGE 07310]|uniref:Uncharacterized protein n=1 Tax=Vasconcelosia minhoensis LEGE 07310 TaxID=915328 RepID=A0A8J7AZF6_9CYAN|nr:hypothetical protein [Romeria gracilis]MBE9079227.1 hypothetical protein [Romeria aff. gracilis LEGE 07310]
MATSQIHYEALLAACCQHQGAIRLLQQYRPYLETLPSMRRPQESIISIPLPNIRSFEAISAVPGLASGIRKVLPLPCDVAFIMCDPEWKIKTETEIFLFICRPEEDFSTLLARWRQAQVCLEQGYEWIMPLSHRHLLPTGADQRYPLFAVFADTPKRIVQGLQGAGLPTIVYRPFSTPEPELTPVEMPVGTDPNSPYLDEAIAEMDIDLSLDVDDGPLGETA